LCGSALRGQFFSYIRAIARPGGGGGEYLANFGRHAKKSHPKRDESVT
jgi:hypothetical protein